jgi:hypothetical protein
MEPSPDQGRLGGARTMEGPAGTFEFMLLGYSVILGMIALFLVSLIVRFRNLGREVQILEEIEEDDVG